MARVSAVIAKVRELLQKNPLARYGLMILVVVVAAYLVAGRLFGGRGAPSARSVHSSCTDACSGPGTAAGRAATAAVSRAGPASSAAPARTGAGGSGRTAGRHRDCGRRQVGRGDRHWRPDGNYRPRRSDR